MPIYRLLQNSAFGPEAISVMAAAFEGALTELKLTDRADPLTEIVAKKIIEVAQQGERDPVRMRQSVLSALQSEQ
jgi:hypothetical protein